MQIRIENINRTDGLTVKLKSIKGFDAFTRIYLNAKKIHSQNISLAYTNPNKALLINRNLNLTKTHNININNNLNNNINIYFGVTIGKKNTKKAVCRNRVKRLLRQAIFIFFTQTNFPEEKIRLKLDNSHLVFSARYKLSMPSQLHLQDIQPEVDFLLNKLLS